MKSIFSILHPMIQQMLIKEDILTPTIPQQQAIPVILSGSNIVLIAPTGHGKTEAALLPVFHQFLNSGYAREGISILYITPLRALNRDMLRRTLRWGEELGINIAVRHGDTANSERARQSRIPPDMIITTPETLQVMFTGKRLRRHLSYVRWVIVDEIHELINDERGAQLAVGLERLYELTKSHGFQRIGLSATIGSKKEVARFLGGVENQVFREVSIVDVDAVKTIDIKVEIPKIYPDDELEASKYSLDSKSYSALRRCKEFIEDHISTLLFINTRDGAEILASRFHLKYPDIPIGIHHGSLSKQARVEAEEEFKKGLLKGLICTSSLELGIDVGNTDFIIQYNSPREVTRLVQRIGRSGHRVGEISRGVIITTNPEDLIESLVIAKRTVSKEYEESYIRRNPLSVLANQIISIALEYGRIDIDYIYSIITRAYPFYSLERRLFDEVVNLLVEQRSIWQEDNFIGKRRRSRTYFLDNISMIPDEKTFLAVDVSSRRKIGKLDESFVLNYGFEGVRFILKGRPWIIVKREEEEILVAPAKELGEAPSWIGEDIPVPFEIAREVGYLRRILQEDCRNPGYPCSNETFEELCMQIKDQQKQGFVVPNDETITIEIDEKLIIINACFGTKVNETLGRLISALLAQSIGESIGVTSDPYRINLELPIRIPPDRIKNILYNIKPDSIEYILHTILRNSTTIRWHLVHVARKFGALRKDFDYKNIGIKKLFTLFEESLILKEAVDKLIWDRMDITHTQQVIREIQQGKIKFVIQRLSPIGLAGTETMRGLMAPPRADRTILFALKKRLEETPVIMICTNCYNKWETTVKRLPFQPRCPRCKAIKIAAIHPYNREFSSILRKKHFTKEDQYLLKRLMKNSSLVLTYGRPAVLALIARGIGPDTAARILRMHDARDIERSEETMLKFLKAIQKAEIQYARTRGFWDS